MGCHQRGIAVNLELADKNLALALQPCVGDQFARPFFAAPIRNSHGWPILMRIASAATACTRQFFMPGIARPAASTAQTTRSTRAGATIHPRRLRRVTAARAAGKLTVLMASLAPTTPKAASNSRRWSAKEGVR